MKLCKLCLISFFGFFLFSFLTAVVTQTIWDIYEPGDTEWVFLIGLWGALISLFLGCVFILGDIKNQTHKIPITVLSICLVIIAAYYGFFENFLRDIHSQNTQFLEKKFQQKKNYDYHESNENRGCDGK